MLRFALGALLSTPLGFPDIDTQVTLHYPFLRSLLFLPAFLSLGSLCSAIAYSSSAPIPQELCLLFLT